LKDPARCEQEYDEMSTRCIDALPAELLTNVFYFFGADATAQDWMAVEAVNKKWRKATGDWVAEWVSAQPGVAVRGEAAIPFLECEGTKAQEGFLIRHLSSEWGAKATLYEARTDERQYFGGSVCL
jgi:hypothetical protein